MAAASIHVAVVVVVFSVDDDGVLVVVAAFYSISLGISQLLWLFEACRSLRRRQRVIMCKTASPICKKRTYPAVSDDGLHWIYLVMNGRKVGMVGDQTDDGVAKKSFFFFFTSHHSEMNIKFCLRWLLGRRWVPKTLSFPFFFALRPPVACSCCNGRRPSGQRKTSRKQIVKKKIHFQQIFKSKPINGTADKRSIKQNENSESINKLARFVCVPKWKAEKRRQTICHQFKNKRISSHW